MLVDRSVGSAGVKGMMPSELANPKAIWALKLNHALLLLDLDAQDQQVFGQSTML